MMDEGSDPGFDEKVDEEAEAVEELVPGLSALSVVGNTRKLAIMIATRLIFFALGFIIFRSQFDISFQNPYFLILGSSLFLIIFNLVYLISEKIGANAKVLQFMNTHPLSSSMIFIPLSLLLIFPLLGVITFEVLLATYSLMFFLIDVVIALVSLILLMEKKPGAAI